ncbi:MAG: HD domain-containing phosphohydrolase [bacterium]
MTDLKRFTNSIENEELFLNTIKYLSDVIDAKDEYTIGHSERVQRYALLIGKEMSLSKKQMDVLYLSSILHDIGKVKIPISILKSKKKLNKYEFMEIKRHSVYGAYLLGSFRYVSGLQDAIKHHHERYDGKGYPDGLLGENIPLLSRIIAVCDSFDAMTSNRSYHKEVRSEYLAIKEIEKNAGTQFDKRVATTFIKLYKKGSVHLEKALQLLKQQSVNSYENALFFLKIAKQRMQGEENLRFIDYNIGKIYLQQGNSKAALKYIKGYLPYAGNRASLPEIYNEMSSAYYYLNDYEKSLSFSADVIKDKKAFLFEKSRATRHTAMIYFKMGKSPAEVFFHLNKFLEYYNKIESMIEKDKTRIATASFSIIRYNQLINYTKEVKSDLSKYYDAAAFIYLNMGNLERAIENYLKSIDIKHFYGDIYGSIRSQAGIALVYIEQGRFIDAEYNLFEALSYARKLNNKMGLWMVNNNLGRLYMTWKKLDLSEKYYYKAFKAGSSISNKSLLTESAFFLTRFVSSSAKRRSIIKKYSSATGKDNRDSIMTYMIKTKDKKSGEMTEEMFEKSIRSLKEKHRILDHAKLFYNYMKYLKENNSARYASLIQNIPSIIKPISDSIVRRRLEKIYDINSKIGGNKRP